MVISRIVIAKFQGLQQPDWSDDLVAGWTPQVKVFAKGHDGQSMHVFMECMNSIPSPPEVDADGRVVIPQSARKELEQTLELASNLLSIMFGVARSLRSPDPCLVLKAETEVDREFLANSKGIACCPVAYPSGRPRIDKNILQQLRLDRIDGISLLAEAYAQAHPMGRFHEFFRLFERAFRIDCEKLGPPLSDFLKTGVGGYALTEVSKWIALRGPATHADRRPDFLLERDIFPVISRMEQAAVDVLLNKETWRTPSSTRLERWKPTYGTADAISGIYATQGQPSELKFSVLDAFGVYPQDLKACIVSPPVDWWFGRKAS